MNNSEVPPSDAVSRESSLDAQARMRLALDAGAIAGTWVWHVVPDIFTADERFARSFGLDAKALEHGMPLAQVVQSIHPDDESLVQDLVREALARGGPYRAEYRVLRDGAYRWVEANGRVDQDDQGQPILFPGVLIDIDVRKRAELRQACLLRLGDALRGTTHLPEIARAAGVAIGSSLDVLRAGVGLVDPVAQTVDIFDDWRADDAVLTVRGQHRFRDFGSYIDDLLAGRIVAIADVATDPRTADYAQRWAAFGVGAVLNVPLMAQGRLAGVALVHDARFRRWSDDDVELCVAVADRAWAAFDASRAQRGLRELDQQFERKVGQRAAEREGLWRLSQDLMLVCSTDGSIAAVNPAWQRSLGWAPQSLLGGSLIDLIHPDHAPAWRDAFAALRSSRHQTRLECRLRSSDNGYRTIEWLCGVEDDVVVGVGRDVTVERLRTAALQETEAQLRQAQKMEAVGQLTGGLAHDFNNLLSSISLSLEVLKLRSSVASHDEVLRHLSTAMRSVRAAATLNQRLLAFSRRQSLDYRAVDIDRLVASMVEILRRTLGEQIRISTNLRADGWLARTDASQLESALMNLAINARDAMPSGGKLAISVRRASIAADSASSTGAPSVPTGDYLAIDVADSGTGMDADTAAKAFEPFFTTKGPGQGSGLGLSMIHGFAKQSGGDVAISTAPGQGTTVTLWMPRSRDSEAAPVQATLEAAPSGNGQRVLLVEDNDVVRSATAEALIHMGYAVTSVQDADEALEAVHRVDGIELMISDVGLPGTDGRTLAARTLAMRPALRVILVSGYSPEARDRGEFLPLGVQFLQKPYALADLGVLIARTLGAPTAESPMAQD